MTTDKPTTTASAQPGSETARKWDDPRYWQGVTIGKCDKCRRNDHVLRLGLCWTCEHPNS